MIKIMNNKMTINVYLSTVESKNQTKQTRRTEMIMGTGSISMVPRCEGCVGTSEEVRGLRSTNR